MLTSILRKIFIGIEICEASVNAVQVMREKDQWRLLKCISVPFPEETINISYKEKNIIDSDKFIETVKTSLDALGGKGSFVGLSIPNKIVKISILKFEDLPKTEEEIIRMIVWQIKNTLRFPEENEKISYHRLDEDQNGKHKLFITMGNQDVLKQYEIELKKLKLKAKIIRPAGVNQFNFFSKQLPLKGNVAYAGVYNDYFIFFVFENGLLQFCRGVKKGFSDANFLTEADRTQQHYLNLNPDKDIDELYIGSQVASHRELEEEFSKLTGGRVFVIDEGRMISTDFDLELLEEREKLSSFVSAIGAAQSLAQ
jgi:Tfp pilus assembly PilM family ATPase